MGVSRPHGIPENNVSQKVSSNNPWRVSQTLVAESDLDFRSFGPTTQNRGLQTFLQILEHIIENENQFPRIFCLSWGSLVKSLHE